MLIVKYKQEQFRDYFGSRYASLPIEYVEQKELKGTAAALITAKEVVGEKFFVLQGDHAPLDSVLNALDFFRERNEKNFTTYQSDSEIKRSSVEVEVVGSKINNSLIFGHGMVVDSLIENSILYCRKIIRGETVINKILVG